MSPAPSGHGADPLVACFTHTNPDHHDPATDTYLALETEVEVYASDLSAPFARLCRNRDRIASLLEGIALTTDSASTELRAREALDLLGGA